MYRSGQSPSFKVSCCVTVKPGAELQLYSVVTWLNWDWCRAAKQGDQMLSSLPGGPASGRWQVHFLHLLSNTRMVVSALVRLSTM